MLGYITHVLLLLTTMSQVRVLPAEPIKTGGSAGLVYPLFSLRYHIGTAPSDFATLFGPDQPRLGASVMTQHYRYDITHTSPRILQPAEPTRPLKISSSPKPNHRPKADQVLWLPHATGPAPFGAKETDLLGWHPQRLHSYNH